MAAAHNISTATKRANAMAAELEAFSHWWFEITCLCRRSGHLAFAEIPRRDGVVLTIGDAMKKLVCSGCGSRRFREIVMKNDRWRPSSRLSLVGAMRR